MLFREECWTRSHRHRGNVSRCQTGRIFCSVQEEVGPELSETNQPRLRRDSSVQLQHHRDCFCQMHSSERFFAWNNTHTHTRKIGHVPLAMAAILLRNVESVSGSQRADGVALEPYRNVESGCRLIWWLWSTCRWWVLWQVATKRGVLGVVMYESLVKFWFMFGYSIDLFWTITSLRGEAVNDIVTFHPLNIKSSAVLWDSRKIDEFAIKNIISWI